ncbi:hypothetical protein PK28_18440 (plasmid) [Hymenobacter sp. DG25B]|uniref:hypothetical protein n=1 Tax=Hymenobacter sp. DG25B TaxID=1385664 RepID=UPI0005408EB4|nr:hypothetical protein [Hymenobacter sp. DG25B]AIZ65593.1 hypothetical protein PK28_18440 [Hymenobacter sp. DG25B]
MSSNADTLIHPLLRVVLERVLRTECLVLEGLRLQTQSYNGQPGGGGEQRLKAAEQRAYQRAEILLTQLLAATAATPASIPNALPDSSS